METTERAKGYCNRCFWLGQRKPIILLFMLVNILTNILHAEERGKEGKEWT